MTAHPPRRYALDRAVRRSRDGLLLSGGLPARLIRLSESGGRALEALLAGDSADGGGAALARRLEEAGMIQPLPPRPDPATRLTTVVPVRDGGPGLGRLVEALRASGDVIVVDDGSSDGSPGLALEAGASVLPNSGAPGPAGARNTGLAAAGTELVAFLDADCAATPDWSASLAALLADDPRLALAAPRVRSAPGRSRLARYETRYSPLDLGAKPSLVGPRRRISYLPSAALVARRDALREVGGFDERLRTGEDVDLVWRLLAADWRARYEPRCEVVHRPRKSAAALARQRFAYGGSAPVLERLHPGAAAPLRIGSHTLAVWLAGAALGPAAAATAAAGSALRESARGSDNPARRALAAVVLRGHAGATVQLARALTREWLPLTALACAVSPRARRIGALALALDAFASARPGAQRLDPLSLIGLRALDRASYSAGLWRGLASERSLAAIAPRMLRRGDPPIRSARRRRRG